jgi:hypothetical protein
MPNRNRLAMAAAACNFMLHASAAMPPSLPSSMKCTASQTSPVSSSTANPPYTIQRRRGVRRKALSRT